MTGRSTEESKAFEERRTLRQQEREWQRKALARAVANVLDGSCNSCEDAARGQGVYVEAVRKAVKAERERTKAVGT